MGRLVSDDVSENADEAYDVLASPLTTRLAVIKCGGIPSWPALAPTLREKIALMPNPIRSVKSETRWTG